MYKTGIGEELMHRSSFLANVSILQFFVDVIILSMSLFLAYGVAMNFTTLLALDKYLWILIIFVPTWTFHMHIQRMYDSTTFLYPDRVARTIIVSSLVSTLIAAALIFFIHEQNVSRLLFILYVIIATILLISVRFINILLKRNTFGVPRVVIVGTPHLSRKFRTYLSKTNIKINLLGFVQIYPDKRLRENYHLGYLEDLEKIIMNNALDEVIFALPRSYVGTIEPYIKMCEEMGITTRMVVDLYDLKISRTHLSYIGTFPMFTFHSVTINKVNLLIKRIIDIVGAIVGLLITSLLAVVIIISIRLESRGPAVFSQNRVGVNGRTFKIYKFRSMYLDAEERKEKLMKLNQVDGGFMFKIKDDPRITKVGKFLRKTSLDELPQFLNVFKGEMSLVGTRPPTIDEVSKYETYHRRRLSFKPGLTGLWQVSGRSNITDFDDVVKLDTSYIDQWSLWLDIKIILKTVKVILWNKSGAM
jgi:exopolysaccharide biosynthesis polyprenyl glycosylphosphotransferase